MRCERTYTGKRNLRYDTKEIGVNPFYKRIHITYIHTHRLYGPSPYTEDGDRDSCNVRRCERTCKGTANSSYNAQEVKGALRAEVIRQCYGFVSLFQRCDSRVSNNLNDRFDAVALVEDQVSPCDTV